MSMLRDSMLAEPAAPDQMFLRGTVSLSDASFKVLPAPPSGAVPECSTIRTDGCEAAHTRDGSNAGEQRLEIPENLRSKQDQRRTRWRTSISPEVLKSCPPSDGSQSARSHWFSFRHTWSGILFHISGSRSGRFYLDGCQ